MPPWGATTYSPIACLPPLADRSEPMAADDRWWGARARLHVSAWRGSGEVAVVSPLPQRPLPSADQVAREVERLAALGVTQVLTSALHHGELAPFLGAGFEEHERLHLLRHDLTSLPDPVASVRHRRGWRRDHPAVLEIDTRAFEPFWALDRQGLEDAIRATPTSRFRVAIDGDVVGYIVSGRSMERGYVQRLAVDPAHHRQGIGRALVIDGLHWLRRGGARVAVVNTQEHNAGALALYRALGFVSEPQGLTVLTRRLGPTAP
jgi:ribosomal protein S18 acetylase RimI-like enzyme